MILVGKMNGDRAEIYNAETGSYQRSLCSDAVGVTVQGNIASVTKKNGRVEIYNAETGSYQRSL